MSKGRRVPPKPMAMPSVDELIIANAAKTEIEAIAVLWAMQHKGGNDWLAIGHEPPATVKGGRQSWIVHLDRLENDIEDDLFLVEVRAAHGGYQLREYTGPVWRFTPPKGEL